MNEEAKKKVLVVEDNYQNRVLVNDILTMNGYEIIEAETGAEAITLLAEVRPDVILMDLHLPQMDGVTATRLIKSDARNSAIPVLALTASTLKGDEDKLIAKGFDGYVGKPIDVKELLRVVSKTLGGDGGGE